MMDDRPAVTGKGDARATEGSADVDSESTVTHSEMGPTTSSTATSHAGDGAAEGLGPGSILDGKYEILGVLGRGGMGTVLSARHLKLDVPVAIKVLRAALAKRPGSARRLLGEARAVARITHQNVVRVFDVGTLDSGAPFIVMERLFGSD